MMSPLPAVAAPTNLNVVPLIVALMSTRLKALLVGLKTPTPSAW